MKNSPRLLPFLLGLCGALGALLAGGLHAAPAAASALRPPSVPLIAHDPYFSIWSPADRLTDTDTTHWTGKAQALRSLVRIDGQTFRLLGAEPAAAPAFPQRATVVDPTRTVCTFGDARVEVTLEFLTPALPDDLVVLARPLTYVAWSARSLDGQAHAVQVYFDAGAELAVHTPDQPVRTERADQSGVQAVRVGTVAQRVLARQGDDVRIDWGYAYLAGPVGPALVTRVQPGEAARAAFAATGQIATADQASAAAPAAAAPALVARLDFGAVGATAVTRWLMLAYDDVRSIRYFDTELVGYWQKDGQDFAGMLAAAARDYPALRGRCLAFDAKLRAALAAAGGPTYAAIGALAYRQTLAGCKLAADRNGQPLLFPKENHSNGCIATVDVIYPMAPFTLLFSPALTKAMVQPILDYAVSPRWKFDFAPHDLGRYPHATGQVYGGGERTLDRQMMVEESANMLLLVAALARSEGSADYVAPYWKVLGTWAEYLRQKGFDPENQLCTDDFAGHLAHNVNLSAKAIVALGAYAQLAAARGEAKTAADYRALAQELATRWVREAADGDHFRLAFDRPGTWSQKYNLVWDRLLGLGLFPAEALRQEMDYYRRLQAPYGLALDSRSTYTKLDWIFWTATLTGDRADFAALTAPVLAFLNATPDRSPMTDWYFTDSAKKRGFTARPVVGGVFVKLLDDPAGWQQWAQAGANTRGPWAPLVLRAAQVVLATGEDAPSTWKAAPAAPTGAWQAPDFDDRGWSEITAPLGQPNGSSAGVPARSSPKGKQHWLRRTFTLPAGFAANENLHLRVAANGEVLIWLNGVPAAQLDQLRGYLHWPIAPAARAALHPGQNVIALQCTHPGPGAPRVELLDAGLVTLAEPPARGPRVVCLGDSITRGGYPEEMARLLGPDVEVCNAGVNGNTSAAGLKRLPQAVLARQPAVVVILFGTNDNRLDAPKVHVPVERYTANLRQMIAACAAQNARVVLCTPPPINPEPYFQRHVRAPFDAAGGLAATMERYGDAVRQLAAELRLPLVDLQRRLTAYPAWMSADGVHPAPEGKVILARLIGQAVAPLVDRPAPASP